MGAASGDSSAPRGCLGPKGRIPRDMAVAHKLNDQESDCRFECPGVRLPGSVYRVPFLTAQNGDCDPVFREPLADMGFMFMSTSVGFWPYE